MKLLEFVLFAALVKSSWSQNIKFCGLEPCFEPLNMISCADMIDQYFFQGSCCAMEDIVATRGCRITIADGNCVWSPKCGECDILDDIMCNKEFRSESQTACPVLDYDPLAIQANATNSTVNETCSPTIAPTRPPSAENNGGEGPDGSASGAASSFGVIAMSLCFALAGVKLF